MSIAATKQYQPNRYWGRQKRRGSRAGGHHRADLAMPRPPAGTVLPVAGMIVGPDPWPHKGPAKLDKPLYIRHPEFFSRAVSTVRRLVTEGLGRAHHPDPLGVKRSAAARKRMGLSCRQVARLQRPCQSSSYAKLANRR